MEQITQLFEILKQTPEMALWGLIIWCLFVLAKIASWVGAVTIILKLAITRYFNSKDQELSQASANRILEHFNKGSISSVSETRLIELLSSMKSTLYIHESDIEKAIEAIRKSKAD